MSVTPCRRLAILILCSCLPAIPLAHGATGEADKAPQTPTQAHWPSGRTYPQIVRISYVEGDVRIWRGKQGERATGSAWETTVADLPVETGFSLATGTGRAEIEFEDASTVYLGENSVLSFSDLRTKGGVPYTQVALLSGTVTLHVHPSVPGEWFILSTPTDNVAVGYPQKSYMRVNSYLDAMAVTPLKSEVVILPGAVEEQSPAGQTIAYNEGRRVASKESSSAGAFAEWDNWVANRIALRSAAMTAVMKDAGLTSPIPGLADMNGQGKFFRCAPYGTCWEPTDPPDPQQQDSGSHDPSQTSAPSPQQPISSSLPAAQAVASPRILRTAWEDTFFPCPPAGVRSLIVMDPATGQRRLMSSQLDTTAEPYDWAVCHAGSWIYRRHHYAWVVGKRRHHRPPVCWIRSKHSIAYVPIHPHDIAGKLPINRKHVVFAVSDKKNDQSVEQISLDRSSEIELLHSPPKEFRKPYYAPLTRAGDPNIETHLIGDRLSAGKESSVRKAGATLTFDRKSQSFMLARQVTQGSKSTTVLEAFNGRNGNFQARAGGFDAHGNSIARANGGSGRSYGGRTSGSGNTGGGFRGGGGGFGGSSAHH